MTGKSQNNKSGAVKTGLKSKKRDRSASEERLIKAGLEVFAKNGFNGATTRIIAQKAGVNESLIGRYFDGKEGLLIAIVQTFIQEMIERELPYPPQDSLQQELKAYIRQRLELGCSHANFVHIIMSQALVDRKFKKRAIETVPIQVDPHLIQRVQLLAENGKLNPSDVEQICEEVDTFMDGLFFFEGILHETAQEILTQKADRFIDNYCRIYKKN